MCILVLLPARELLNSGVSPDLVNEDGLTALHQVNMNKIIQHLEITFWFWGKF